MSDPQKLHRSSYAIKSELQPGLENAITTMQLRSVGELLSLIARDPAASARALKPLTDKLHAEKAAVEQTKEAAGKLKELARRADPAAVAAALKILDQGQK
jgi:hypothetical protein